MCNEDKGEKDVTTTVKYKSVRDQKCKMRAFSLRGGRLLGTVRGNEG